jgi:hypothetical protein
MPPRYVVRRQRDQQRYSVWDNETGKVAVDGDRQCDNLSFGDAFDTADNLNMQKPNLNKE